jgi:Rod binding domain-containing protein
MDTIPGIMNGTGLRLAELGDPSVARSRALDEQAGFASVLSRAQARPGAESRTPQQRAREAAEQLVATALVQPVLKQLRETNNAVEPFKPNSAEKSFSQMMDTELSQRIVKSRGWALVDRVADTLLKRGGIGKESTPAARNTTLPPGADRGTRT